MNKSLNKTWWSQQWLNALNQIDFSNRLTRGRNYASKGLVEDFESDENKIKGKVRVGEQLYFNVSFELTPFSEKEKNKILDDLNSDFLLLSQVLNQELPTRLIDIFKQHKITVFPKSWKDLNGECNCEEKIFPCKHIAALLYWMTYKIDQNPFMVFQWRNLNLLASLSDNHLVSQGIPIVSISPLRQPYDPAKDIPEWDEEVYKQLDFSAIPNCKGDLLSILSEKPDFYPQGDFKKILELGFVGINKKIKERSKLSAKTTEVEVMDAIEAIELLLDRDQNFLTANFRNSKEQTVLTINQKEGLLAWIEKIPRDDFFKFSPALKSLSLAYDFSVKLLESSAVVPQLVCLDSQKYAIRWLPALVNPIVKSIYTGVKFILQTDLLFYKKGTAIEEPIQEEKTLVLLSFFLDALVHKYHNLHDRFREHTTGHLFFNGIVQAYEEEENKDHPRSIQLWLSKFFIGEKNEIPVFQITEAEKQGFLLEIGVQQKGPGWSTPIPLDEILEEDRHRNLRNPILRDMAQVAVFFPKINTLLERKGNRQLYFDSTDFVVFLHKILPTIRLFGIKILLSKKMRKLLHPKLTIKIKGDKEEEKKKQKSVLNLKETLNFSWQVAIGEEVYTEEEFLQMVETYAGIVKLKDEYVFFDEKEIKILLHKIKNPPPVTFSRLLQSTLTEDYEGAKVALDKKTKSLLNRLVKVETIEVPKGLKATLRPYQQSGYEWLYKNIQLGLGSLIADDMGLGKTLQVIATLLKLKEDGALGAEKALIIVPTTLLTNWSKEIQKFAPNLKAFIYHGSKRSMTLLEEHEVMISTYGVARSETALFQKEKWLLLAIDEAQHIKTPGTAQTKAIKKIDATIKIAMSGTPVENRLSEYWSIFDFTNKGYLDSLENFTNNFANPIEVDRDQEKLERFRKVTAPFILRRLKSDKTIIKDLPDKIESDQYCSLSLEQSALYQNVVKTTMKSIATAKGPERKGLILKLITSLKQVCNHPQQFLKKGKADPTLSGKTLLLFNLLRQIHSNGEKTLIFTQYQEMGKLLVQMMKSEFGWEVPFLHGGLNRKERDQMVDDLQNNRSTRILILSLKAGGTGLNLTAANNVIHYDLWWNPAAEAQATDRAFRIGQRKNVMVRRFITQGTFEEKINELLQHKKELADLTVSTGEKWIGAFSDEELRDLVGLE